MNHYWRSVGGRVMISRAGRLYRQTVLGDLLSAGIRRKYKCRLYLHLVCQPPDQRKRDLDNLLKPLLDALQHAGLYEDDSQIDRLMIERGRLYRPHGRVVAMIGNMEGGGDAGVIEG